MFGLLRSIIANKSFHQSGLLTAGTIVNSLLGLVFYVFLARTLAISQFGYVSFLLGIGVLAADLTDFGMGTAILKFGREIGLAKINGAILEQRILVGIFLVVLALLANSYYPAEFLLAGLVAISLLLVNQFTQSLLSCQAWKSFVTSNVFGNLVRLALVIFWNLGGQLSAQQAMLAVFWANILAGTLALLLLFGQLKKFPIQFSSSWQVWKKILPFSHWLGLSFGLSAIASRLDVPLVYFLGGSVAAGVYSSASKLVSVFPQVVAAIEGVFAPKISAEVTKAHLKDYFWLVLVLAGGLVLLAPFSGWLVVGLLGEKYQPAVACLQILLLSMAVFCFAGPFSARLLYRHGKSKWHAVSSVVSLFVSLTLYFLLIPVFGAYGAALASLGSNLVLVLGLVFLNLQIHD